MFVHEYDFARCEHAHRQVRVASVSRGIRARAPSSADNQASFELRGWIVSAHSPEWGESGVYAPTTRFA